MDINLNNEVDNIDLENVCWLLVDECSSEEVLSICQELGLDCQTLTLPDNAVKTISIKTVKGLFLVGKALEQGKFSQLVEICEKLYPHIIPKVHRAISRKWQPKFKLEDELISLVDGIFGFPGQPYIPTYTYDRESHSEGTQCYCWRLESSNRGGIDISQRESHLRLLAQVREALSSWQFSAFAYISDTRTSTDQGVMTHDCIVVVPTNDPLDAIRIEKTNDGNCWFGPEEYIRLLNYFDNTSGIDVVAVYQEYIEVQFKQIPQGERLQELKELLHKCFSTHETDSGFLNWTQEDLSHPVLLACDD